MKTGTVNLGLLDSIALGHGKCFVIDGEEIAVFRSRSGRLLGLSNRCPHRGGPLVDGIIGETHIVCPLHGHKFDVTSGAGQEAGECIKAYRVWDNQGQLMLEKP